MYTYIYLDFGNKVPEVTLERKGNHSWVNCEVVISEGGIERVPRRLLFILQGVAILCTLLRPPVHTPALLTLNKWLLFIRRTLKLPNKDSDHITLLLNTCLMLSLRPVSGLRPGLVALHLSLASTRLSCCPPTAPHPAAYLRAAAPCSLLPEPSGFFTCYLFLILPRADNHIHGQVIILHKPSPPTHTYSPGSYSLNCSFSSGFSISIFFFLLPLSLKTCLSLH